MAHHCFHCVSIIIIFFVSAHAIQVGDAIFGYLPNVQEACLQQRICSLTSKHSCALRGCILAGFGSFPDQGLSMKMILVVVLFEYFTCLPVENYRGHFLEKMQPDMEQVQKLPAQGAREARPFAAEATFLYCFHIC